MREWRVGRITLGILFLAVGIVLLLRLFTEINLVPIIKYGVPLTLIILGLEVLIFTLFAKSKVRFSVLSIIVILLILTALFSFGLFIENSPFYHFGSSIKQETPFDRGPGTNLSFHKVDINENIKLPAGVDTVSVDITNGNLEIVGSNTDRLILTGTVTTPAASQQEAVSNVEKYFTTKFVGDELKIDYDSNRDEINSQFLSKMITSVNLKLEVPAGLEISADLINGNISVENFLEELDLKVVNGKIDISLEQLAADIEAETTNGKINLVLPTTSEATIEAEAKIGTVEGNIDWVDETSGDFRVGAKKSAQVNGGFYKIELSTVTGNIAVDLLTIL